MISAASSGFVCGGAGLGFSFHRVEIYFSIFSFHFSSSQLEISQIVVFLVETHRAFAAIQALTRPMPGGTGRFLFAVTFDRYA